MNKNTKMVLFSITKEFLMQDIAHLYKTSPHNLESYLNSRNFCEIANYSSVFVLWSLHVCVQTAMVRCRISV